MSNDETNTTGKPSDCVPVSEYPDAADHLCDTWINYHEDTITINLRRTDGNDDDSADGRFVELSGTCNHCGRLLTVVCAIDITMLETRDAETDDVLHYYSG